MSNFDRNSLMIGLHLGGSGGGGGLPTPTEDGVALIGVDGQWKQQSGYGYESEGLTVEWDGDTEGRETIPYMGTYNYKVSEDCPQMPATLTITMTYGGVEMSNAVSPELVDMDEGYPPIWAATYLSMGGSNVVGITEDFEYGGESFHKGIYFFKYIDSDYSLVVNKIELPSTVHTIDPKFIPGNVFEIHLNTDYDPETGEPIYSVDEDFSDIIAACMEGKEVICENPSFGELFKVVNFTDYNILLLSVYCDTIGESYDTTPQTSYSWLNITEYGVSRSSMPYPILYSNSVRQSITNVSEAFYDNAPVSVSGLVKYTTLYVHFDLAYPESGGGTRVLNSDISPNGVDFCVSTFGTRVKAVYSIDGEERCEMTWNAANKQFVGNEISVANNRMNIHRITADMEDDSWTEETPVTYSLTRA